MVLKEAFAPEAVAPDFPLRAGGLLGLRPRAFYATSSDLVAINNVLRSRTNGHCCGGLISRRDSSERYPGSALRSAPHFQVSWPGILAVRQDFWALRRWPWPLCFSCGR
jgi:hypothetical protein